MSLDLIKKQKANIQKGKRKITAGGLFNHPLAYQPVPKGREGATREEISKIKKKSALDSFCSPQSKNRRFPQAGSAIWRQTDPGSFSMTPDKNAANLFLSKMHPFVPGKRGGHVSDIFVPNKSPLAKSKSKKEFSKTNRPLSRDIPEPQQSYRGYRGKANLMIRVNDTSRQAAEGESIELKDRLGDYEIDLPTYSEEDIYNFDGDSQDQKEDGQKQGSEKSGSEDQEMKAETDSGETEPQYLGYDKPWATANKNNGVIPQNIDYRETTVKFSFVKPNFNLKVAVAEEEEEEEEKNKGSFFKDLSFPSDNDNTERDQMPNLVFAEEPADSEGDLPIQYQINTDTDTDQYRGTEFAEPAISSKEYAPFKDYLPRTVNAAEENSDLPGSTLEKPGSASLIDLRKKSGVAVKILDKEAEEEEESGSILSDYKPVYNWNPPSETKKKTKKKILSGQSQLLQKKIENFWNQLKAKKLAKKDSCKIMDFEFRSGREYDPGSDESLKTGVKSKLINAPWMKKIFTKKEEKVLRKFQGNFFILRSGNAKRSAGILAVGVLVALMIPIGAYVQKVIEAKNRIEVKSNEAYSKVESAKTAMLAAKPEEARRNFETAYQDFLSASDSLDQTGGTLLSIIKVLPGGSKIESGQNILEAGKHLTSAGQIVSEAFGLFLGDQGALKKKLISTDNLSSLKEITSYIPPERQDKAQNLTEAIILFEDKLKKAGEELSLANESLDKVKIEDVPENKRGTFVKLKEQLPGAVNSINSFSEYSNVILSLLGHNQPKQYLFVFENNDEIRATGGFIGTYGIIKIDEGNISQLTIDGIYNPDGQLKERVIPPKPIQKMSATWSMHDANWWPDFPKSAEKIAWFYEKTGGPTVDGVIALTPKLMEDLLKITGPINHDKYGVTVNADNFVELSQYKVEKDYDKKLNRPKQFLADLAPLILEKIFNAPPEQWIEVLNAFSKNLENRDVQMYFFDYNVQQKVSDLGWSGQVLDTPKDYLSVINTNISGLKTDKMIEQKIEHQAEVKPDGSIVDTVTITRAHHGGKEKYEWYNGVNCDWMRVYVPKGSELLHAEGYTREVDSPPLDYAKLGFVEDEMVVTEESGTNTDPYTGTRVYEDSGKTVFANWTYVSPGETLTVKYSYLLPFKLSFNNLKKPADTYSLLVQKQAGDENSWINSQVTGLDSFDSIYSYPDELSLPDWKIDEKFEKDVFAGAVLVPKGTKIE